MATISENMQDYLKTIFSLERTNRVARVSDIARELDVTMSSVNGALKKLSAMNLVTYKSYGFPELTEEGLMVAQDVYGRHQALQSFFSDVLGIDEEIAAKDACHVEHAITATTFARLDSFLDFISRHPQSNSVWIPQFKHFLMTGEISPAPECIETCLDVVRAQLTEADGPAHMRLLTDLSPGHTGEVYRFKGDESESARLKQLGLKLAAKVEMVEVGDLGHNYRVRIGSEELTLNRDEAKLVQVIVG